MRLNAINGHPLRDGLDYEFYSAATRLELEVCEGAAVRILTVEKDEYQPLGCEFASYLIDGQRRCKNRCVFCFIDQTPPGMRPSLYFKDDDERLGFLFGNYVTLTNLGSREVERIIEMRFSPVNVSVHSANPGLRVQMMGNPGAGDALAVIPKLAAAGIELNFQLVLIPGLNDGDELRRSIGWLAGFWPAALSIAAVPVGLTRHRLGLPRLPAYTPKQAATQLDIMLASGDELLAKKGSRLVYPSDEWFLLAGRAVPPDDFYEGYPQLENGVGMWRLLEDEFAGALKALPAGTAQAGGPAHIATGTLAAPLLARLAARLARRVPGAGVRVHTVYNDFFGRSVTVAGLLCGRDIMAQLKGKAAGRLLLGEDMLRAEGDVLLDDTTPAQIGEALGVRAVVVPRGGGALLRAMLGLDAGKGRRGERHEARGKRGKVRRGHRGQAQCGEVHPVQQAGGQTAGYCGGQSRRDAGSPVRRRRVAGAGISAH
jgi:putative radical SAM enzyme (TIGR03279 family)